VLDFHTHVLPGIDDGAADLATGVELCRRLQAQGVTTVIATPHWRSPLFDIDAGAITRAWDELSAAVKDALPGLALELGAENHCCGIEDPDAFAAVVRPLGSSRCVLVELPDDHLPANAWKSLFALIRRGLRPILAHPERCRGLGRERRQLADFIEAGGLLQPTLASLLGSYGFIMRWRSRSLLRHHRGACVIASDCHNLLLRQPRWDRLPPDWRDLVPKDLAGLEAWTAG
jgi:protein-tyrosine phosphatase